MNGLTIHQLGNMGGQRHSDSSVRRCKFLKIKIEKMCHNQAIALKLCFIYNEIFYSH